MVEVEPDPFFFTGGKKSIISGVYVSNEFFLFGTAVLELKIGTKNMEQREKGGWWCESVSV